MCIWNYAPHGPHTASAAAAAAAAAAKLRRRRIREACAPARAKCDATNGPAVCERVCLCVCVSVWGLVCARACSGGRRTVPRFFFACARACLWGGGPETGHHRNPTATPTTPPPPRCVCVCVYEFYVYALCVCVCVPPVWSLLVCVCVLFRRMTEWCMRLSALHM